MSFWSFVQLYKLPYSINLLFRLNFEEYPSIVQLWSNKRSLLPPLIFDLDIYSDFYLISN